MFKYRVDGKGRPFFKHDPPFTEGRWEGGAFVTMPHKESTACLESGDSRVSGRRN